jgi:hypothetical protein
MTATSKPHQHLRCMSFILGLAKQFSIEHYDGIGAQVHEPSSPLTLRLGFSKSIDIVNRVFVW